MESNFSYLGHNLLRNEENAAEEHIYFVTSVNLPSFNSNVYVSLSNFLRNAEATFVLVTLQVSLRSSTYI